MNNSVVETNFHFDGAQKVYHGKVRDMYFLPNEQIVMVVTDRISAFDRVLPWGIPQKGAVLNRIAAEFLGISSSIVPTWLRAVPHPMVTVGVACEPYPVEMVVRGYLSGHAWREYAAGKRKICGERLPEGLRENDKLPEPIITTTTKAVEGHDEDISGEEIVQRGLVSRRDYEELERYSKALFQKGSEVAAAHGLILVDTKYEFGTFHGAIHLIDEIHTPDSSRYFYAEGYAERQKKGEPQRQLSKEFVRQWLMDEGFHGNVGDKIPTLTEAKEREVSNRYIELYEHILGKRYEPVAYGSVMEDIESAVKRCVR